MSDAKGPIQFMLGPPARLYFENLEKSSTSGKFSILLQKYWLCAQLGMVHGRKGNDDGDRKWICVPTQCANVSVRSSCGVGKCYDLMFNPPRDPNLAPFIFVGFFLFFMSAFIVSTILLSTMGLDLETSIGAAASAMGNIGPALGDFGPTDNYALLPAPGKWLLSFCMLLGRLEIFTVMVLFSRTYWK